MSLGHSQPIPTSELLRWGWGYPLPQNPQQGGISSCPRAEKGVLEEAAPELITDRRLEFHMRKRSQAEELGTEVDLRLGDIG